MASCSAKTDISATARFSTRRFSKFLFSKDVCGDTLGSARVYRPGRGLRISRIFSFARLSSAGWHCIGVHMAFPNGLVAAGKTEANAVPESDFPGIRRPRSGHNREADG